MNSVPKKIPLIAAIVLAAAITLLLRPAKPKFNGWVSWHDAPTYCDDDGSGTLDCTPSGPSYAVFNLTLQSPKPTIIGLIIINGRNGEKDCDQSLPWLREQGGIAQGRGAMEMGDTLRIRWPTACGDKIVRIEIDTDRGTVYWSPASPHTGLPR